MKIHFKKDGTAFEYETRQMPEHRFKALCRLAAAVLYIGRVWVVATLCGFWGMLWLFGFTAIVMIVFTVGNCV